MEGNWLYCDVIGFLLHLYVNLQKIDITLIETSVLDVGFGDKKYFDTVIVYWFIMLNFFFNGDLPWQGTSLQYSFFLDWT